jgi:hypothetical protein
MTIITVEVLKINLLSVIEIKNTNSNIVEMPIIYKIQLKWCLLYLKEKITK